MKTELKASPRSRLPPVQKPSHVYTEPLALPSYRPLTPSSKLLFPAKAPKKQSAGEAEGTRVITHHEEAHFVVERVLRSPKRVLPSVKITSELILQMTQAPTRDLHATLNSKLESLGMVTPA